MRLLHFRVRTLMVVVGVVALLIWGAMMGLRSYDYYRRASFYAFQEYGWRETAISGQFSADSRSECAEYFAQLTRKYRRAMWRPWMPVAPDPHAPGYDQWLEQERRAKEVAPDPPPTGLPPRQSQ
jgi:hypothetical protein